jgi:hypothetical protein
VNDRIQLLPGNFQRVSRSLPVKTGIFSLTNKGFLLFS